MELDWEPAGNDSADDQNADSDHGAHSYWSVGNDGDEWRVELIVRDCDLEEIQTAGIDLGSFHSEALAKRAAQSAEASEPYFDTYSCKHG